MINLYEHINYLEVAGSNQTKLHFGYGAASGTYHRHTDGLTGLQRIGCHWQNDILNSAGGQGHIELVDGGAIDVDINGEGARRDGSRQSHIGGTGVNALAAWRNRKKT